MDIKKVGTGLANVELTASDCAALARACKCALESDEFLSGEGTAVTCEVEYLAALGAALAALGVALLGLSNVCTPVLATEEYQSALCGFGVEAL